MTILGRMGCLACVGLVLAGTACGQLGQLGTTVDDARKTDLFTFFHLKESGQDAGSPAVLHFRPSGPDFHDLAEVNLAVMGERVTGAKLSLARSFVIGKNNVFAMDLLRSFLRTVLTPDDLEVVKPLLGEVTLPEKAGDAFRCGTPAGASKLKDAVLAIGCDQATDEVTFAVVRRAERPGLE